MKANESSMHRFLDGTDKKFIIPVYQRAYSWKKQNCELLFKDLMDVYEKDYPTHFFGGIVYISNEVAGFHEYIIIDGQQRMTTISVLLIAIRNYITDKQIEVAGVNPDKITRAYLKDEYASDENKLKLKLIEGDSKVYQCLVDNKTPEDTSCLYENYKYFYKEISDLSTEKIKGLYDSILKLQIVNISLYPNIGDDPQLIFESLNSTGVSLDEADKIRNYVLMNMGAEEQEKIYKQYWEVLEIIVTRTDLNKFIRYYLATKNAELANENKLYFEFKLYKKKRGETTESLLKDMLQYAQWYKMIKQPNSCNKNFAPLLVNLNKLEVNSSIPLIFTLFQAYKDVLLDEEELAKSFTLIESYIIRCIICGLPTNQFNKVFSDITRYLKNNKNNKLTYYNTFVYYLLNRTGKSRFPNDYEFRDKFLTYELYNAKSSIKKYIFERLENYNTKEKIAVEEQIEQGILTIEHIMPQKLNNDWKKDLGENWEQIHTKYKDTIGNLTLTAYNSAYSNLPFNKKKYMDQKGFAYSKLDLNKFVKDCETWNSDTIISRAGLLFDYAQNIWWCPENNYSFAEEDSWVYWDEEISANKRIITKIKFFDNEIKTSSIRDVYMKCLLLFYDLDPIIFKEANEKFYLDIEECRQPLEILKGIYIEGNINSDRKISRITQLAKIYKLDSKDLQYYFKPKTNNNKIIK